ncbi:MAG: hypothetical protein QOG88_497 [Actinomycetota bacterium]|jgi:hypothetical protein|nr:hypothetical protein [Actinomycetota bacterium]
MPLDASKPTPLRLWGFLLTVGGGVLVAFGALRLWVNATVFGKAIPGWEGWRGVDLPEGLVALVCGVVLIIGILVLRGVRGKTKRVIAVLLIIAGVIAFAVGGVVAVTAANRFANAQAAATQLAAAESIPVAEALAKVSGKLSATVGVGVFVTMLGGILGAVGGVLSLALVTRPPVVAPPTEPEEA